jgi:Tol biopolymer transport system component
MRPAIVIASSLIACFVSAVAATAGSDAYPGRNGALLYLRELSDSDQRGRIFVSAADGSGLRDVTPPGFFDIRSAAWSPDGRTIAFSGLHESRNGVAVYLIGADGSGLRRVTPGDHRDSTPTWSPDGKSLAFTSFDRIGLLQIFRSRLDGSGRKMLSNQTTNCDKAEWSPTGRHVVFECGLPGGLVIMRPDGSRERKLTRQTSKRTDYDPAWSPDGGTILFSRGGWTYRIRPDGTGLARTIRVSGNRAISPDGKWMAVTRYLGSHQEVWVMRRNGSSARQITSTVGLFEFAPDWQPLR